MWYMVATLDENDQPGHPQETEKHIFVGDASALEPLAEDLPRYEAYAPQESSVTSRRVHRSS